jgi:hypothetical protein
MRGYRILPRIVGGLELRGVKVLKGEEAGNMGFTATGGQLFQNDLLLEMLTL